jgi:hypothetical protein
MAAPAILFALTFSLQVLKATPAPQAEFLHLQFDGAGLCVSRERCGAVGCEFEFPLDEASRCDILQV